MAHRFGMRLVPNMTFAKHFWRSVNRKEEFLESTVTFIKFTPGKSYRHQDIVYLPLYQYRVNIKHFASVNNNAKNTKYPSNGWYLIRGIYLLIYVYASRYSIESENNEGSECVLYRVQPSADMLFRDLSKFKVLYMPSNSCMCEAHFTD